MALSKSKPFLKRNLSSHSTRQSLKVVDANGEPLELKTRVGKTLLETAVDNLVEIPTSCGGMGTCGTCWVRLKVISGVCPPRGEIESDMAIERDFADDERLSCQIEIPEDSFEWVIDVSREGPDLK